MKLRLILGVLLSFGLACGDDDGGTDASVADASTSDGGSDAGRDDAGSEDGGSAPDAGEDAGGDAGGGDAATEDAGTNVDGGGGCDYVPVDEVVVRCDGTITFVNHFLSEVEGCDDFYAFTPDGPRYDDFASVIASNPACDAGCQYRFSTAVTRLYCERRSGYEVLRAEGCDDIYRFPEGYYSSVEEHDAAHPCE